MAACSVASFSGKLLPVLVTTCMPRRGRRTYCEPYFAMNTVNVNKIRNGFVFLSDAF